MPLINSHRISPNSILGIWKIDESIDELKKLNRIEKFGLNEKINEKKFKESIASKLIIKKLCSIIKLDFHGIYKNPSGKPFLIKNKEFISISHSYPYAVGLINNNKCGIDIEKIRKKILKVNTKFLKKSEINRVGKSLIKNTIYWSSKEALFKAYGGLNVNYINDISIIHSKDSNKLIGKIKDEKYLLSIKKIEDFIITYTN